MTYTVQPYRKVLMSQISDDYSRYKLIGTVIDITGPAVTLSDGEGTLVVQLETIPEFVKYKAIIGILGELEIYNDGTFDFKVDLIQDYTGFDLKSYIEFRKKRS